MSPCCAYSPKRALAQRRLRSVSSRSPAAPASAARSRARRQQQGGRGARGGSRGRLPRRARLARRGRPRPPGPASARALVRVTSGIEADTHESIPHRSPRLEVRAPPRSGAGRRSPEARDARARGRGACTSSSGLQLLDATAAGMMMDWLAAFSSSCRAELDWTPAVVDVGGGLGVRHVPRRGGAEPWRSSWASYSAGSREAWRSTGCRGRASSSSPAARSWAGRASRSTGSASIKAASETCRGRGRRRHVGQPAADALRRPLHGPAREPRRRACGPRLLRRGKHCESAEVLIERAALPEPRRGDLLPSPRPARTRSR